MIPLGNLSWNLEQSQSFSLASSWNRYLLYINNTSILHLSLQIFFFVFESFSFRSFFSIFQVLSVLSFRFIFVLHFCLSFLYFFRSIFTFLIPFFSHLSTISSILFFRSINHLNPSIGTDSHMRASTYLYAQTYAQTHKHSNIYVHIPVYTNG